MKPLLFILLSTLVAFPAVSQNNVAEGDYFFTLEVEFGPGQKKLSNKSAQELRRIIEEHANFYYLSLATKKPDVKANDIVVKSAITIGRTDASGDSGKNQVISQERAAMIDAEIRLIMQTLGVRSSPEAFYYMGIGEEDANEYDCQIEQKLCNNTNDNAPVLPWEVVEPCYRQVMVCPASQRISSTEIILKFDPSSSPSPSPSIIEIPTQPEIVIDQQTEPVVETTEQPNTDVTPKDETENTEGVETKPKPNKLKVYGSDLQ